ncbi:MAG: DRTGG domain-containing protein [Oscillospiraceae bacterium]|nr:DRTGG domain-containing protein [Oscillospiraceae bacterium]
MTIGDIAKLLDCEVLCCEDKLQNEVHTACGSDMMSDVLAFVKDQAVLLTGLLNPQVVRTAEMMDIICIVFVRGKKPDEAVVQLAGQKNIVILSTKSRMFEACGILYDSGLRGGESASPVGGAD